MQSLILNILAKFSRPLIKLISIHYKNYRYLLPNSVNKFIEYKKYRHNNESYDLYGWNENTLIDIYPTYRNIIIKEDLPKSWINYSKLLLRATNLNNVYLLDLRYNLINRLEFDFTSLTNLKMLYIDFNNISDKKKQEILD